MTTRNFICGVLEDECPEETNALNIKLTTEASNACLLLLLETLPITTKTQSYLTDVLKDALHFTGVRS